MAVDTAAADPATAAAAAAVSASTALVPAAPAAQAAAAGPALDESARTVFVAGLSMRTTPVGLARALAVCGTVCRVYMPGGEGQPNRGFAFVEFTEAAAAAKAVQLAQDGAHLDGHPLRIRLGAESRRSKPKASPKPADSASPPRPERRRRPDRRRADAAPSTAPAALGEQPAAADLPPDWVPEPPRFTTDDRGQPIRLERVRAHVRWDLVLEWEDVDMDTVSPKPAQEAVLFGQTAAAPPPVADVAVEAPVEAAAASDADGTAPAPPPPSGPKVVIAGPVPPDLEPLTTLEGAGLHPLLAANVNRCGYAVPTPVQAHVIPMVTAGLDLVACAETGSGKTAAFLLPVLNRLLQRAPRPALHGKCACPTVLILAPTRELAGQIFREARRGAPTFLFRRQLSYDTFLRCSLVHGGTAYIKEVLDLEQGCHVLVATPGRLIDSLDRERISLGAVTTLIIDEGDRMLDMGFEPQLREIVTQHGMVPRTERQTLFFSATFPAAIRDVALTFLRPSHLSVRVGRVGATVRTVAQRVVDADGLSKRKLLVQLLDETTDGLAVVFAETKAEVRSLERFLANEGFSVVSLHGDKTQPERERALDLFRRGEKTTLVTTDVASRTALAKALSRGGLDIPAVTHVINYDLPSTIDDYVHRVGRTGRAGRSGRATSLYTRRDAGIAVLLADALREAGQAVPEWLEPSSMAHLMHHEDYRSWDKIVLARQRAAGDDGLPPVKTYASVAEI